MKKSIIKKKYSSLNIFQVALFLVVTCFQLFFLIKNTNIVSSYIEAPIIFKIILFIFPCLRRHGKKLNLVQLGGKTEQENIFRQSKLYFLLYLTSPGGE